MSQLRSDATPLCPMCGTAPVADGAFCVKCAAVADAALDEVCGGAGEFEKLLTKHLAKGTRQ